MPWHLAKVVEVIGQTATYWNDAYQQVSQVTSIYNENGELIDPADQACRNQPRPEKRYKVHFEDGRRPKMMTQQEIDDDDREVLAEAAE